MSRTLIKNGSRYSSKVKLSAIKFAHEHPDISFLAIGEERNIAHQTLAKWYREFLKDNPLVQSTRTRGSGSRSVYSESFKTAIVRLISYEQTYANKSVNRLSKELNISPITLAAWVKAQEEKERQELLKYKKLLTIIKKTGLSKNELKELVT